MRQSRSLNPLAVGVGIQRARSDGEATQVSLNPLAVGVGIQRPYETHAECVKESQSPRGRGRYSTIWIPLLRRLERCLNPLAVGVGIQRLASVVCL